MGLKVLLLVHPFTWLGPNQPNSPGSNRLGPSNQSQKGKSCGCSFSFPGGTSQPTEPTEHIEEFKRKALSLLGFLTLGYSGVEVNPILY